MKRMSFLLIFVAVICLATFSSSSLYARKKTPGEKLDEAIDKSKDAYENAKDQAREKIDQTQEKVQDKVNGIFDKVRDKVKL